MNLHHHCRLIINVELPWNPNRLEQRIGRVDRLGQTRTVHAIHLVAAGTPEDEMLTRLTHRVARIAATLGDGPAVLRDAPDWPAATHVAADEVAADDVAADSGAPDTDTDTDTDGPRPARFEPEPGDACRRRVSTAATEIVGQLQQLRDMQARARRSSRRHAAGNHASRGDPLLTLDERAPLLAVVRTLPSHHPAPLDALESPGSERRESQGLRSPGSGPVGGGWLDSADSAGTRGAHASTSSTGLLCLWRTRIRGERGDALGRADPSSAALSVMHIACDVPRFSARRAIAAFVTSTLERCRPRLESLLDRELAAVRDRLDAAERAQLERLARRDTAIDRAISVMLQSRAAGGGLFQPLLFEDIAAERTPALDLFDEPRRSWMREPASVGNAAPGSARNSAPSSTQDTTPAVTLELATWSLAMVLVIRQRCER